MSDIFFLQTTQIKPRNDYNKTIYKLGSWCYKFDDYFYDKRDDNYHWKNRVNLKKDYNYLKDLSEKVLNQLVKRLNNKHLIDKDKKYWRFILGLWLEQFLQVIYDRWLAIQNIDNKKIDFKTEIINFKKDDIIALNTYDNSDLFWGLDYWNHYLFGEIIKFNKKINFHEINDYVLKKPKNIVHKSTTVKKFLYFIFKLFEKFNFNYKLVFFEDVNILKQLIIFFKIGQLPIFINHYQDSNKDYDFNFRNWSLGINTTNEFEKFIDLFIPKNLPKSVLESYKDNLKISKQYPQNNIKAFIVSGFDFCDNGKIYLAEKNESKKIVYQHGGAYGQLDLNWRERKELMISDHYLTWGWNKEHSNTDISDKDKNKIIAFHPMHINRKNLFKKNNNQILIILDNIPNFCIENRSTYMNGLYKYYLKEIFNFIKNLDKTYLNKVKIRLYRKDYEKNLKKLFLQKFPNLQFENYEKNILTSYEESKICIIANNATAYLESFSSNTPTVIFWNKNYSELRESAKKHFKDLEENSIYHSSGFAAAEFINKNYDNIEEWWNSNSIIKAKKNFLNIYLKKYDNFNHLKK